MKSVFVHPAVMWIASSLLFALIRATILLRPSRPYPTCVLATICAAALPMSADGQSLLENVPYESPLACVEALHAGLIRSAAAADSRGLEQRSEGLRPLIVATHDLRYIAEFTVRRHWERFNDEERQAFLRLFERLSVTTYASRFVAVEEDTLAINESRQLASGRAQVVAAIARADGTEVPLEYTLQEDAGGWRIVNVIADGVSDLALKRAEYQRILSDGSVANLLSELDAQISAL